MFTFSFVVFAESVPNTVMIVKQGMETQSKKRNNFKYMIGINYFVM